MGIILRTMLPTSLVVLLASFSVAASVEAATLKVSSFPSGAQVSVDGVNTGKVTPMNVSLPEGDHSVTVQIPGSGWNPDTRTVTIVAGNNDLNVTLLPTPAPGVPGPQGNPGTNGTNGTNGSNGADGTNGAPGTNGIDGTNGTNGSNGIDGTNGAPGTNGIDGTDGQDATTGATRPDPPCFDNTNRYVDCGNGTVTDTVTGLIWLRQANCFAGANYAVANQAAAGLAAGDCSLTDGSSPGDWRLPTKDEWSATIARPLALGCRLANGPPLTKDAGTTCFGDGTGSSFAGVAPWAYWSSTAYETFPNGAWHADLINGLVEPDVKGETWLVWPVRGGTR